MASNNLLFQQYLNWNFYHVTMLLLHRNRAGTSPLGFMFAAPIEDCFCEASASNGDKIASDSLTICGGNEGNISAAMGEQRHEGMRGTSLCTRSNDVEGISDIFEENGINFSFLALCPSSCKFCFLDLRTLMSSLFHMHA
jgi:hypothetical protein